jgi:SAM-dependent methyltransferase
LRCRYAAEGEGLLGRWLLQRFHDPTVASLTHANVTRESRILDVGCGVGRILHQLKDAGFSNVLGIDPYLDRDLTYPNGLRILKQSIHELEGEWDLIMFHHSFEHVPDPLETLRASCQLLSDAGCCLIRTPVASSYAWQHYREHWVQIDAPRHLYVQSVRSLELLAKKAGLRFVRIFYDSNEFQFWGSEQSRRGVPVFSERSYATNPSRSCVSTDDIRLFRSHARVLNMLQIGDQAAFYLAKSSMALLSAS